MKPNKKVAQGPLKRMARGPLKKEGQKEPLESLNSVFLPILLCVVTLDPLKALTLLIKQVY
jgi:hypothetical protein